MSVSPSTYDASASSEVDHQNVGFINKSTEKSTAFTREREEAFSGSSWWDLEDDNKLQPSLKKSKIAVCPLPKSVSNSNSNSNCGNQVTKFNNVSLSISGSGSVNIQNESEKQMLVSLTNFTGTIDLTKCLPPSRFSSSFNTSIDSSIPTPLAIPSWLTAPASASVPPVEESYHSSATKKAVAKAMARVTTPDSAEPIGPSSGPANTYSYGVNRRLHVAWINNENVLCVHGGFSLWDMCGDLLHFQLNSTTATVTRRLCESHNRAGHSAVRLTKEGLVVLFGGETATATEDGMGMDTTDASTTAASAYRKGEGIHACALRGDSLMYTVCLDTLLVLDTSIDLWYPPAVSGKGPSARSGHTAQLLLGGRAMVVYGGQRKGRFPHNIHVLDTTRWHWASPKCDGNPPKARAGHCCHPCPDITNSSGSSSSNVDCSLLIFGGHNDVESFNDIVLLKCVEKREGSSVLQCKWEWFSPIIRSSCSTGEMPLSRTCFASCIIGGGKYLYVQGGQHISADNGELGCGWRMCADAWVLDLHEWMWYRVPEANTSYCVGNREVGAASTETETAAAGAGAVHHLEVNSFSIDSSVRTDGDYEPFEKARILPPATALGRSGESAVVMQLPHDERGERNDCEYIVVFGGQAGSVPLTDPDVATPTGLQIYGDMNDSTDTDSYSDSTIMQPGYRAKSGYPCANVTKINVSILLASLGR